MRRTSSLGRRSSTLNMQCGRSNLTGDFVNREDAGKRKSKLPKPCLTRASSVEKLSSAQKESSSMKRANSQSNIFGSCKKAPSSAKKSMQHSSLMTPVTPGYRVHANLPTGMSRPKRSQTVSTENNRMSSIGGSKIMRKDTRPLTDKAYMNQAIERVKIFFQMIPEGLMLFGDRVNIVPLSTNSFIDIVSALINILGVRSVITKTNYVEEVPIIMKKLGYRGKVERSWLITVSAPHSSYYAIGLIEWLVIIAECLMNVDIESLMYSEDLDLTKEDYENDDARNFKILTPHLQWGYDRWCSGDYNEEVCAKRDEMLYQELVDDMNLGDIESLTAECEELENEVNNPTAGIEEVNEVQHLKETITKLIQYLNSTRDFILKSKTQLDRKQISIDDLSGKEDAIRKTYERRKAELENLRTLVNAQEIQLSDIKKLNSKRLSIERHMNRDKELYKEFESAMFKEDLLLVSTRKKLDNEIIKYNKEITKHRAYEPRLKNAEMDGKVLNSDAKDNMSIVDNTLKNLKVEYKLEKENLETKEEESVKTINQLKEDLFMISDDVERMQSEKISLEQDLNQTTKDVQMKRKEKKDECAKLKCYINELMTIIGRETDGDELQREKAKLKDIEHDLALIINRYDRLFEVVKNAYDTSNLQEKIDKLIEKCEKLNKF